ncbi:hypothetical protein [uncultured Microscilla sp.]|uniref:hypothetical protein n=1 Tax=uncultured Microscilla sp. TaxID=432653 RepID=UPI0026149B82|nr:hypothetical protein [uncultured Microscilla sp.]
MLKNLFFLCLLATIGYSCTGLRNSRKQALDENIIATTSQLNIIKTLENKIQKKLVDDSNNAIKSYLPILKALETELKARKTMLASLDIKKDSEKIEKLTREYRKKRDEEINLLLMMNDFVNVGTGTVKSEGTFESGEFTLSADVKSRINLFVKQVKDSLGKYEGKLDATQSLQVEITTTGYSDAEPLRRPNLIALLKRNAPGPMPRPKKGINYPQNRKYLNKVLSRLRAKSVYKYLDKALKEVGKANIVRQSDNVIGLGETYPYRDIKDYLEVDERRRICKFSVAIIPVKSNELD